MMKTAVIFPGQASQYVGMGRDLHEASAQVRELYRTASALLQYDLPDVSFNGPLERLTQTAHTQPALLVHSLAVLLELGGVPEETAFVAGHSLGEYSALAAAGVLTPTDAIAAVRERSRAMQAACDQRPGTMAALLNCDGENLERLVQAASSYGIVQTANFNSPGQVAISGERPALEQACAIAKSFGAKKAIPLTVGGAFHSPLMQPAQEPLAQALRSLRFAEAKIGVVCNVTATAETDGAALRELLVRQLVSPVLWTQSIQFMADQGVRRFIEIGPGKVLSGLVKRTVAGAICENVDTLEDLLRFREAARV